MPLAPKSRNLYWPLTWARLAMTRTSAAMMPQPPSQPTHGLKVRVAQVNVVPQSGSALLSSLYPMETKSMGTNASTTMIGESTPDGHHDQAEGGRQAVGGSGGGHADHDVRDQAHGIRLEPLVDGASAGWSGIGGVASGGHLRSGSRRAWRQPTLTKPAMLAPAT